MKFIFISDLHLKPESVDKNKLFYSMLATWRNEIDALYILGDFFDYWVGDDDTNDFINEMKENLRRFTKITPIYFKGGNHDFAVGKKFAQQTGISLIKDLSVINIGKFNILLSHGDTFCTLDLGYQKMKRILQNPILMFVLLRLLPLKLRYKIKEKLEHKSGEQTNSKPPETYEVVDTTIAEFANARNANTVIHGHTHHPGQYIVKSPQGIINRYEIPDWEDHTPGGYLEADEDSIKIYLKHPDL